MDKKKEEHQQHSYFLLVIFVFSLIFAIFTFYCCISDISNRQFNDKINNADIVMEIRGGNVQRAFQEQLINLEKTKRIVTNIGEKTESNILNSLNTIYEESEHEYGFITTSGAAYDRHGYVGLWEEFSELSETEDTFFFKKVNTGNEIEERAYFVSPFAAEIHFDNFDIEYGFLNLSFDGVSDFFDLSDTYGEGCSVCMINRISGDVAYGRNTIQERDKVESYIFDFIKDNFIFKKGYSFEQFRTNVNSGDSSIAYIKYKIDDKNYYFSYHYLGLGDYYTFFLIPENNVNARYGFKLSSIIVDLAFIFCSLLLLFFIGLYYFWKKTATKQKIAIEAAKESDRSKTNFLSSMSHDIRTPMNAIIGFTDLALRKGANQEDMREFLTKIKASSSHLLTLINDILDISKIESGKIVLNNSEFSLINSLNTIINLEMSAAKKNEVDLRVHTHDFDQEYFIGDELRINQVCINLVSNAIKYTKSGGRVDFDLYQLPIIDKPDYTLIKFVVNDNGMGMSEEFQKVMYDSFSRSEDTKINKIGGTGLGLTICKEIVELMNGDIKCQSELNVGTTFTVTFELKKGKPDEVYKLPPLNVLVYDQDEVSTKALERILDRLDIKYTILNDFKHVYQKYDLAIICLEAPEKSGLDIAKKFKRHFPNMPIVLTDTEDMANYSKEINRAKIRYMMSKPYCYRLVYQSIRDILDQDKKVDETEVTYSVEGMNILVAEDNDMNWEILDSILAINNIKTTRANNGLEAFDIISKSEKGTFDCILMDIRMPIMDGRESTRKIRAINDPYYAKLPIVAMTADAFSEDIEACLECGMDNHLSKPIDVNRLLTLLSKIKNHDDSFRGGV